MTTDIESMVQRQFEANDPGSGGRLRRHQALVDAVEALIHTVNPDALVERNVLAVAGKCRVDLLINDRHAVHVATALPGSRWKDLDRDALVVEKSLDAAANWAALYTAGDGSPTVREVARRAEAIESRCASSLRVVSVRSTQQMSEFIEAVQTM